MKGISIFIFIISGGDRELVVVMVVAVREIEGIAEAMGRVWWEW